MLKSANNGFGEDIRGYIAAVLASKEFSMAGADVKTKPYGCRSSLDISSLAMLFGKQAEGERMALSASGSRMLIWD